MAKFYPYPAHDLSNWQEWRARVLHNMQCVMGEVPHASRRVPLEMQTLAEERLPHFTRRKISFVAELGDRVPAYLLIPHDICEKRRAVLCLHPTSALGKAIPAGIAGSSSRHYAAQLAERGYITLAPDYPLCAMEKGEREYVTDPYSLGYVSATMKAIWNHMRAGDLLQSLPEVDARRIGCIGHSLGGHNAIFLGAFDLRIKAMVSCCGFTMMHKYMNGDLSGWSHQGYMPRIAEIHENDPRKLPFDFPEVIAALAPRPFLAVAPLHDDNFELSGVQECIAYAKKVYNLFDSGSCVATFYPDCGHDFPDEARQIAYEWFERFL
jgi:dienelactone hydrolase